MLSKSDKEQLKKYGIDPEKLVAAVTAEAETALEFSPVVVFTEDEIQTRDANMKAEGLKEGESIGEKKGKELAAKVIKRAFSLGDDVPADIEKVKEALKTHVEKGDPGVKAQVESLLKENETLKASVEAEKSAAQKAIFNSKLIASMPANRAKTMTDDEYIDLLHKNLAFEFEGDKTIIKRNGQIMQDPTTKAPLDTAMAINVLFTERGWVEKAPNPGGGRGGSDTPPGAAGSIKTLTQFQEKFKAENPGKDPNGAEFLQAVQKHAKEVTDFDFHS